MKRIKERNAERAKEFAAKQAYNEKLLELYMEAKISREDFEARIKK